MRRHKKILQETQVLDKARKTPLRADKFTCKLLRGELRLLNLPTTGLKHHELAEHLAQNLLTPGSAPLASSFVSNDDELDGDESDEENEGVVAAGATKLLKVE